MSRGVTGAKTKQQSPAWVSETVPAVMRRTQEVCTLSVGCMLKWEIKASLYPHPSIRQHVCVCPQHEVTHPCYVLSAEWFQEQDHVAAAPLRVYVTRRLFMSAEGKTKILP